MAEPDIRSIYPGAVLQGRCVAGCDVSGRHLRLLWDALPYFRDAYFGCLHLVVAVWYCVPELADQLELLLPAHPSSALSPAGRHIAGAPPLTFHFCDAVELRPPHHTHTHTLGLFIWMPSEQPWRRIKHSGGAPEWQPDMKYHPYPAIPHPIPFLLHCLPLLQMLSYRITA